MGAVLNPTDHSTYFDEIRSLISPDHLINATNMPDSVIDQFGYLGRAEVAVLRATNLTSADLRPSNNTASLVPSDADELKEREYVWVIQGLTAYYLIQPQVIQESDDELSWRYEEIDVNQRKRDLVERITDILPSVLIPDEPADTGGVIGTQIIKTEGVF